MIQFWTDLKIEEYIHNINETTWNSTLKQGLIQKEKVHIGCAKGAQISILANKIATQWWFNIIIR